MTKPDPSVPDPETPDPETPEPDPADPLSPAPDASGVQPSGEAPSQASQANESPANGSPANEYPESAAADALSADAVSEGALSADDDAVWLDLVARLEGVGAEADEATGGLAGGTGSTGAGSSSPAARTFRDFDPLGLAGAAPIELSAKERQSPAPGKPAAASSSDVPDTAAGPRDYEPEDDDGAFVPEEPPSLAGADPMTVLAWLGAVGGPIALVLAAMFWRSAPLLAILGIVAVFAASVVFLIMKLPDEKDEHDDGARV